MCAGAEMDGSPVEADQFGQAQACLDREQQHGVIAPSEPCRAIGSGQDRLDLGPRQTSLPTVSLVRRQSSDLDTIPIARPFPSGSVQSGFNEVATCRDPTIGLRDLTEPSRIYARYRRAVADAPAFNQTQSRFKRAVGSR